jgi:hypothetical protein
MVASVNTGCFIRIHLINRIIQMSVKKTKDQRLSIVIGLNDIIELDRHPKFKIFGLKQNGQPITKMKTNIGWYSFSDKEVLSIYKQLKNDNCYLTDKFE